METWGTLEHEVEDLPLMQTRNVLRYCHIEDVVKCPKRPILIVLPRSPCFKRHKNAFARTPSDNHNHKSVAILTTYIYLFTSRRVAQY